jgi:hypothetical protein
MSSAARAAWILAGCTALALLIAIPEMGCGSSSANGTGGSTGSGGADVGSGGAGAGTGGGGPGTGGAGGGTTMACKNEMIQVISDITANTTWECNSYVLRTKIHIVGGATLTIAAGSTIYGEGGTDNPAALISTRDGKLVAVGTAEKPIVFTSIFPAGGRMSGDGLAGLVMLGRAPSNNGSCQGDADPSTTACDAPGFLQGNIEGIDAADPKGQYGGTDPTYNCGELKYVRVEFAGFIIGANNELNGITLGGCGSQTKLSYIQVHRGLDDGIEFFAGTASMDHVVLSGMDDDGLDWDFGWQGKVQFLIVHQGYGKGDKGFESDNNVTKEDAEPRSNPEIWNATLIGEGAKIGMHLRRGTRAKLRNFIVMNFGGGAVDIDATQVMPAAEWPNQLSIESSVFFPGTLAKNEIVGMTSDNDMGFDEAAAIMDAARMNVVGMDPMIGAPVIATGNHTPNYIPAATAVVSGKATPPAPLDTTATYAGAVAPGTTTPWYAGWTSFPEN